MKNPAGYGSAAGSIRAITKMNLFICATGMAPK